MAQAQTAEVNLNEILRQVAREKDIDLERWISALEDAMASAAKKQHRIKEPVRAHLDRESGKFDAFIVKQVVETVEDPLAEWTVDEARDHKPNAEVGDEVHLPIPTDGLGRIAAQSAKQVLYQRVREAERENIYNEYIDRVGEVLNGTVKRFERGDIIIDLGRTEAVVPRSEQARHERYSQGERIRAVIVEVHKQPKGPQIVLSRTDPRLLVKLFEGEVPHLDVIVEDEQLSLAIGKRGQNVRLASELIGSRIDIKSESDVKDEVADALARMLNTAMAQIPTPARVEVDVFSVPGIAVAAANALKEAGFGSIDSLAETEPGTLLALGLDELSQDKAESAVDWAKEQVRKRQAGMG